VSNLLSGATVELKYLLDEAITVVIDLSTAFTSFYVVNFVQDDDYIFTEIMVEQ